MKFKSKPGTNPALSKIIFDRKMAQAQELEKSLEAKRFEVNDDYCHIIMSGKPTLLNLTLKRDCTASHLLIVLNEVLSQVHIYRDGMAKDLIGGNP